MLSRKQPISKEQENSSTKEMQTMQNQEENSYDDELSYQDEHWKIAHKMRKIIPGTSVMKISDTERQQWLQDIPLRNSIGSRIKEIDTDPKEKVTTHIVKPLPIYIDAQIIDPLIGLLNNTAGKDQSVVPVRLCKSAQGNW